MSSRALVCVLCFVVCFSSGAEAVACGGSSFRFTHTFRSRGFFEQFFLRHTANGYLRFSPSARYFVLLFVLLCVVCVFFVCFVFVCKEVVLASVGARLVP